MWQQQQAVSHNTPDVDNCNNTKGTIVAILRTFQTLEWHNLKISTARTYRIYEPARFKILLSTDNTAHMTIASVSGTQLSLHKYFRGYCKLAQMQIGAMHISAIQIGAVQIDSDWRISKLAHMPFKNLEPFFASF